MSIPVSTIVNVTISTTPTFPSRGDFGLLNIVGKSDVISLGERFRLYTTIDEVAADFATTDEEYIAATVFFSQNPRPNQLMISRRADVAYAAELRGGLNAEQTLATWVAITDGEFAISIDGVAEDILAIDFTGDTSLDDVAASIEAIIQAVAAGGYTAATCTWNGDRFTITSGTTGATSTITVLTEVSGGAGTSIVTMLDAGASGGTAIGGVDLETITESLDAIQLADDSWYGLAFTKELNDDNANILLAADWCEARIKLFANSSTDANVKDVLSTTDIAYVLEAGSYRRTFTFASFSSEDYIAISAMARLFIVNFSGTDTTITLKFKILPTITADDLNTNEASVISGKSANYYASFGDSEMIAEGVCADGSFIDSVHGIDWLQNAIETNVFGRLYTETTKVPLTDKGAAQLAEQVRNALDEAVTNGLVAPGTTNAGTFLPQGYVVTTQKVADMSAGDRAARKGPLIQFTALGAGAIHSIEINGVFEG